MKSAYELAMERLAKQCPTGPPLTDEQKQSLAEIDNRYTAKIAEVKILADQGKKAAGSYEELNAIESRLQEDLRRLETEKEEKKAEIRKPSAS